MWYAVDIDDGIIAEYETKREAILSHSEGGGAKKLSAGVYETRCEGSLYAVTTYIINSSARDNAELHGFGWVFEEDTMKKYQEIKSMF